MGSAASVKLEKLQSQKDAFIEKQKIVIREKSKIVAFKVNQEYKLRIQPKCEIIATKTRVINQKRIALVQKTMQNKHVQLVARTSKTVAVTTGTLVYKHGKWVLKHSVIAKNMAMDKIEAGAAKAMDTYLIKQSIQTIKDTYDLSPKNLMELRLTKRKDIIHTVGPETLSTLLQAPEDTLVIRDLEKLAKYVELPWMEWLPSLAWRLKIRDTYKLTFVAHTSREKKNIGKEYSVHLRLGKRWIGYDIESAVSNGKWLHRLEGSIESSELYQLMEEEWRVFERMHDRTNRKEIAKLETEWMELEDKAIHRKLFATIRTNRKKKQSFVEKNDMNKEDPLLIRLQSIRNEMARHDDPRFYRIHDPTKINNKQKSKRGLFGSALSFKSKDVDTEPTHFVDAFTLENGDVNAQSQVEQSKLETSPPAEIGAVIHNTSDTKSQTKAKAQTKAQSKTKAQAKIEAIAKTEAQAKTEVQAKTEAQAKTESQPKTNATT